MTRTPALCGQQTPSDPDTPMDLGNAIAELSELCAPLVVGGEREREREEGEEERAILV